MAPDGVASDQTSNTQTSKSGWFLGPKAENADAFEDLLLEVFRDYCFWRRNFHPEDRPFTRAVDRLSEPYSAYWEELRDRLFEMTSALKLSVPFFSPRYLGHMNTDLLVPGLLGYFGGMLYNQNNIVSEAAPLTMRFEAEAVQDIVTMFGMDTNASWGHICSGGTTANMEALWVALGVRLFPFQLALAYRTAPRPKLKEKLGSLVMRQEGSASRTTEDLIKASQVHTVTVAESLALRERLHAGAMEAADAEHINACAPMSTGLSTFERSCAAEFESDYPRSLKILVSSNAHYCQAKSAGVLGLGKKNLVRIDLDSDMRLSMVELTHALDAVEESWNETNGDMLIAVVGVYGSTEEGAIDEFDRIVELRQARRDVHSPADFWLHADACYGGYAAAMARSDREFLDPQSIFDHLEVLARGITKRSDAVTGRRGLVTTDMVRWSEGQCERWLDSTKALADCDSIAVDPHKLGYLPYPSGVVAFSSKEAREFIRFDAPYLNTADDVADDALGHWHTGYLGRYTLEGSRPGAAATALWAAHKCVPLTHEGHGRVVAESILGARYLQRVMLQSLDDSESEKRDGTRITVQFLNEEPDLNILCYSFAIEHDGETLPLAVVNACLDRLYEEMLPTEKQPTPTKSFVVAKTALTEEEYGQDRLRGLCEDMGLRGRVVHGGNPWRDDDKVTFLRTVVMGPFLTDAVTRPTRGAPASNLAHQFCEFLRQTLIRIVSETLSETWVDGVFIHDRVLVLEDDETTRNTLIASLRRYADPARSLSLVFGAPDLEQARKKYAEGSWAAAVVDLQLQGDDGGGEDFLEWMSGDSTCRGSVIYSARMDDARALGMKFEVAACPKPVAARPGDGQVRINRLLEELWEVLARETGTA